MINVLTRSVARSGEEENGCPYGLSPSSLHSLKRQSTTLSELQNQEPHQSSERSHNESRLKEAQDQTRRENY